MTPTVSEMTKVTRMDNNYPEAVNAAVATELVAYRAAARMTQRELIERTGISKSKIIRIEAGQLNIGTRDIALITDALGVDPLELMQRAVARAKRELASSGRPGAARTT